MINEKYSYQNFTNPDFTNIDAIEFNNMEIHGSNFYIEDIEDGVNSPFDIFPNCMTGVKFINCNLDNILVPDGNTLDNLSKNRRIKVQADGYDYLIDTNGNPLVKL